MINIFKQNKNGKISLYLISFYIKSLHLVSKVLQLDPMDKSAYIMLTKMEKNFKFLHIQSLNVLDILKLYHWNTHVLHSQTKTSRQSSAQNFKVCLRYPSYWLSPFSFENVIWFSSLRHHRLSTWFLGIKLRTYWRNGLKFGMTMNPEHLQNWLDLVSFCWLSQFWHNFYLR